MIKKKIIKTPTDGFYNSFLTWVDSNERGFPFLLCSGGGKLNMAAWRDDVTVYNATEITSES